MKNNQTTFHFQKPASQFFLSNPKLVLTNKGKEFSIEEENHRFLLPNIPDASSHMPPTPLNASGSGFVPPKDTLPALLNQYLISVGKNPMDADKMFYLFPFLADLTSVEGRTKDKKVEMGSHDFNGPDLNGLSPSDLKTINGPMRALANKKCKAQPFLL